MTATLLSESPASTVDVDGRDVAQLLRDVVLRLREDPGADDGDWPQLTMQQVRVMHILAAHGPTRVSTLARTMHVSTPTMTGILDRLVQRDMVRREDDPHDRRVVLNVLTPAGHAAIEQINAVRVDYLEEIADRLSPEDRRLVMEALNRLREAIDAR